MPLSIPLGLILGKIYKFISPKHIDNSPRCMVLWLVMNKEVQAKIAILEQKGWTLTNIGRALELKSGTIESWKAGKRSPANPQPVLASLSQLEKVKRIPKKKIYSKKRGGKLNGQ
jgi:hypothetical protein